MRGLTRIALQIQTGEISGMSTKQIAVGLSVFGIGAAHLVDYYQTRQRVEKLNREIPEVASSAPIERSLLEGKWYDVVSTKVCHRNLSRSRYNWQKHSICTSITLYALQLRSKTLLMDEFPFLTKATCSIRLFRKLQHLALLFRQSLTLLIHTRLAFGC